jgi:hypothetical protein
MSGGNGAARRPLQLPAALHRQLKRHRLLVRPQLHQVKQAHVPEAGVTR